MGLSHRLIFCKHHIVKLSTPIVYIAYQYCSTIRIINPYQYPIIAPPKKDRNVIQTPKELFFHPSWGLLLVSTSNIMETHPPMPGLSRFHNWSSHQADVARSFQELQNVVSQLLPWLSEALCRSTGVLLQSAVVL